MAKIELVHISKAFDARKPALTFPFPSRDLPAARRPFAIENLNLTVPHAKTLVILGPSGCGKTTILKMIAGLIEPDAGEILYNGTNMQDVPPGQRGIGFLFQGYALYPHLTSKTNILSYFFFKKKTPTLNAEAQAKYKRTSELLGVEIEYLQDRMPSTLSGGERQRVALGRCITRDPVVFLLDEPFSNLDPKLREKYRVNLKTLLTQFNVTTVYVTHDQQEAFILADIIAIMDTGRIEQTGTYEDIYNRPKNVFIAEFLHLNVETPPINWVAGARVVSEFSGDKVGARSEDVLVTREPRENAIQATVRNRQNLALKSIAILTLAVGDDQVVASVPIAAEFRTGDQAWLTFRKYHVFDHKTQLRTRTILAEPPA
ncbi:MAG: ABC transporter ATP-binding protein [Chloroflexi bacterium]|nr:ABC transporter ATP-binding protein [Chloroflexota bacterium]